MNELYHHGILGQKWGVRRFENKDGKLTDAGKKRYKTSDNLKRVPSKYKNSDGTLTDAGKARYHDDGRKRTAKNQTDKELKKSTDRLNTEANYNRLTKQDSVVQRGNKKYHEIKQDILILAAIAPGAIALAKKGAPIVSELLSTVGRKYVS